MTKLRMGIMGGTFAVLAGFLCLVDRGLAGEETDVVGALKKIAAAIQEGKADAAAKEAKALVKKVESLDEVMHGFKPRKKGGIGVGAKPGAITPDGIELMLQKISRDVPSAATLSKDGPALEQMGYHMAAIGEVAKHFAPKRDKGQANKKNWNEWTNDMNEGALELAKAAAKKGGQEVKTAASKTNNACNSCHMVFRN